jgi:CubicO group peptidase (beta-lactamase class C family)
MHRAAMSRLAAGVTACLLAYAALGSAGPLPGRGEPADVGAMVAEILAEAKVPGGVAVVLHGDRVVAQGVAGVRRRGSDVPVSYTDQFHLGSCTKAMTATLVALLEEEGSLTRATTLGEIFGGAVANMDAAWRAVPLEQLLGHRAGMPANPGRMLALRLRRLEEPVTQQRARVAAEVLGRRPETRPGTRYLYSNVGYIVAGAAVERVAGQSWEDLMRERLFGPLGITSGGFGPPGTPGTLDQPRGHRSRNHEPVEPGPAADNPAVMGPAATVHMSVPDWAKFVAVQLRGHPANPRRDAVLLPPEAFDRFFRTGPGESYAGGWIAGTRRWARGTRPEDTGLALSHAGSNTLWHCVAWLAPEIDFAILVALNAADDAARAACTRMVDALAAGFAPGAAAGAARR